VLTYIGSHQGPRELETRVRPSKGLFLKISNFERLGHDTIHLEKLE